MGRHALLSASSSHRWLACPPSARLCENYEDTGSEYAQQGTDAHSLCEHKLKLSLGMETEDPTEGLSFYDEEMEECACGYAEYVLSLVEEARKFCKDPVVLIEQRLDFSRYVEEGFGTGDCVVIADGTLYIIDYKHGKGVEVSAEGNPQMMLYALGALELFDGIYDIDTVRMAIYQPRRENVSVYAMEFKLPFRDSKRPHLDNEKQVQIVNDVYRIRTLTDDKGADGKVVTSVYAEAAFYDLAFSVEKAAVNFNADTAEAPMAYALEGTDWSVGNVTVRTKRTWQSTEKNALSILRQVQNIHGGDLIFDCANHLVHLLTFGGTDSGVLFAYRKNMKSIQRVVDTRSLVTRLYAYGKDGMIFASINGGKEYVESYAYTDEVRTSTLDCSSFTNPYQMLEFAEMRLADYAKPRISYVLSAMDLSVLTGYEHETWDLGDIVTVDDRDLNLSVKTRIVRRQYNLQEPWNTVLELSTTLRELGDSSAQWDKAADVLSNTDVIDLQEVKDMVPFNHLRNSRADSGMNYWLNSGFEVDAENGVSGTASFKCVGAAGMTKSLAQTVYPASRNSYTFSAQIASENLKKGAGGQVGIEVTFEYEDGTTETRFIDLL